MASILQYDIAFTDVFWKPLVYTDLQPLRLHYFRAGTIVSCICSHQDIYHSCLFFSSILCHNLNVYKLFKPASINTPRKMFVNVIGALHRISGTLYRPQIYSTTLRIPFPVMVLRVTSIPYRAKILYELPGRAK